MKDRWHVCLTGGQKIAWALDEDLLWVQKALGERAAWVSLPRARIVHAAWPAAVNAIPEGALRGKTVVCQADNPPSFYLGTEGFAEAAAQVDLWIARTHEATAQFQCLGLRSVQIPYCVNPEIFRPLPDRDKIRQSLGLSANDFVIGNFHRDSEGADLTRPKKQKGPDIFFEIAKKLHLRIPNLAVLLAGPRRHWLLNALRAEGIRTVFAGNEPGTADDYKRNILPRERLNELYQALDVCVISSRWEGGPYSVLEALAAGTTVMSTPVGTSRDLLPQECIYHKISDAVDSLERQSKNSFLSPLCKSAALKASSTHSPEALKNALLTFYNTIPTGGASLPRVIQAIWSLGSWRFLPKTKSAPSQKISALAHKLHTLTPQISTNIEPLVFPNEGSLDALISCAAQIVATRKS